MSKVRLIPLILAACAGQAVADATLTYELSGPDGASATKTLSIARFFARIDDTAKEGTYLIYQAGKFFPLYEVNPAQKAYTRLTPEVKATLGPDSRSALAEKSVPEASVSGPASAAGETPAVEALPADTKPPAPAKGAGEAKPAETSEAVATPSSDMTAESGKPMASATEQSVSDAKTPESTDTPVEPLPTKPALKASNEKREIAGVECRVVEELRDGKPVLQHCMANKARLGITEREIRTLARTFVMARERNFGWLGVATGDEEFVSIQTLDPATGAQLVLKEVSTAPLPQGHLKIPREYRQQNP